METPTGRWQGGREWATIALVGIVGIAQARR
jgi:hypothetical protein